MRRRKDRGQAILEYILMTVMLAVTMAVVIRNVNRCIYTFWTGLTLGIANACPDCKMPGGRIPQDTAGGCSPQ